MSRHRNIRQMDYEQDYDDYYNNDYDDDDDYLYDVSETNESSNQINKQSNKVNFKVKKNKFRMPTDANKLEKLMTCVCELKTIFGDSFSDEDYKVTATKYNYDFRLAYDFFMYGNDKKNTQKQDDQNKKKDQQNRVTVHLKKENKNSAVEKTSINKQTKNYKDNSKNDVKNENLNFKNTKVDIKNENTPKNKNVTKLDLGVNIKEYEEKRKEAKNTVNLVIIGHVDSGKSTLMGHLLVKMGYVSSKNLHSYQTESKKIGKASFSFAWVLDQTEEERRRGITIDVAHLSFETETKNIMLLDAPGHKDFIPNMITGASQADAAILVVDATTNEFESGFLQGGQTKEHTMLIKSFGISQLAVAINKLENVNWSEERFVEIEKQLKPFIKQVGFKLSSVNFIPCSGLLGENLSKRSTIKELTSWYTGPCLLEAIENFKPSERLLDKHLRFFVNSVYKNIGLSGINLSGKVEAGAIRVNQKLVIRPNNETCTVKSIKVDDKLVQTAFAGDRIDVCLSNVDEFCLRSRYVLCSSESLIPIVSHIEAKIVVFSNVIIPITAGMDIVFHYKTSNVNACVFKLLASLDRSTGEVIRSNPRCLSKNTSGVVEIKLNKPICLELYQNYKELGRFMLRSNGVTVAAGIVNKILKEENLSKDF